MNLSTYRRRSLAYHRRSHLAVALGVAVGCAALTGALLVGDSMRGSLRQTALGRLGRVDYALLAPRFFGQGVADRFDVDFIVPAIIVQGSVTHADTQSRANRIQVLGVTERFWQLSSDDGLAAESAPGRTVILNRRLADELGARPGDAVLLRVGLAGDVATESLLGRRDQATATLRLTVAAVIASEGLGGFAVSPRQQQPANAFVPLATLQRAIGVPERVNALLATGSAALIDLQKNLTRAVLPEDLGLRLRRDDQHGYVALESDAFLLEPPVESAGLAAAEAVGASTSMVLTYLANTIAVVGGQGSAGIPYSTVSAVEPSALAGVPTETGQVLAPLEPGHIVLNHWAADDLNAHPGDRIGLTYYMTGPLGELRTETAEFDLLAVVPLDGLVADPGFTPSYPGVTDVESLSDWDPPFPVDLKRVRDKDDAYWKQHRATPKAFVALQDGVRLWADQPERFGRLTSLRLTPPPGMNLESLERSYAEQLQRRLPLAAMGMQWDALRERALAAGQGSTDFGGLFIGFSFFLIISAAMLVALLFRLAVERRAGEVGLLLATGFSPRRVAGLLVWEGGIVAALGAAVGLAAALGYAWLMLAGLRSFWSAAVNAPFLRLHVGGMSLVIGYLASLGLAVGSMAWSIRGLTRIPARALLAGSVAASGSIATHQSARFSNRLAGGAFLTALALLATCLTGDAVPQTLGFFGGGAAAMVGCLAVLSGMLLRPNREAITRSGPWAWVRLGLRNAPRNRGRSMLTVGLIASASFVIVALQAFRLEAGDDVTDKQSGSGGFALMAESAAPLHYDLNDPAGRESLNVDPAAGATLSVMQVWPMRLRPGDETSCLNLYTPDRPRILGAPPAMIDRGGYLFESTLDASDAERENPWTLLRRRFEDGAIPVIGDQAAVKWQMHLGLGQDLVTTDERGGPVRLRFVALLTGSALQGEIVMAQSRFVELYPSVSGYQFFLIEAPSGDLAAIEGALEKELAPFGFDVIRTQHRLAELLAVQNTYLSTFQLLGGLGLILGTVGLAAVLLRNVFERRGELALMRAVGFSSRALGWMVLSENAALVLAGLVCGVVPALLAIAPAMATQPGQVPWLLLGMTLCGVLLVGMLAGLAALIPTLRSPLLPALRCE